VTSSYIFKLLCLSLATFSLIYAMVGCAIMGYSRRAFREAGKMNSRTAANYLLFLRLLPAGSAALAVIGFCVPSYLLFEPEATQESVGLICLTAAAMGAVMWTTALFEGMRGTARHLRFVRKCGRAGHEQWIPGESRAAWVLEGTGPLLALTGFFRSRIVVSEPIVSALTEPEMAMVLRHEQAHRASHDNLKRLLLLWSPGLPSFTNGFRELDLAWARFAEWAADDAAAAGDPQRALALAEALVRVARMGAAGQPSALVNTLVTEGFSVRVDRLLREPVHQPIPKWRQPALMIAACIVPAGVLISVFLRPATLSFVHRLLENLLR